MSLVETKEIHYAQLIQLTKPFLLDYREKILILISFFDYFLRCDRRKNSVKMIIQYY